MAVRKVNQTLWVSRALTVALLLVSFGGISVAHAQGPTPPGDQLGQLITIGRLVGDLLQGKTTVGAEALFEQSKRSAAALVNDPAADLFFLDFGNPNLAINQFAATVARNLLALTPLYVFGYLAILVFNIWKERPIPNPLLYLGLVVAVMLFLAAFAVITQGISQVGRALAVTLGGSGDVLYPRAALLDAITRVLILLQKNGGILSVFALVLAIFEGIIILIQLAYRGISMAIWRVFGVLLIPLSVLLEGVNPKTAGKVVSGFFEAWLDLVGKIALLLVVLAVSSSEAFASSVWFVLPAGLLIVILSWKFFGVLFTLIRDSVARGWRDLVGTSAIEIVTPLPASAEAARAREIDEERRRMLEE